MAELKPCPFCGGEASVTKVHPFWMLKKYHYKYFAVGCKGCGAFTSLFKIYVSHSVIMNEEYEKNAAKKAIEAWNRRANDATPGQKTAEQNENDN